MKLRLASPALVFSLIVLLVASCAVYNSNSSDKQQYGPVSLDSSDPNFAAAYQILSNRCISCHTHSSWSAFTSNDLWISNRKVVKNSPNDSILIQQIQIGAMPQDGSIPPAETQKLVDWITNMP